MVRLILNSPSKNKGFILPSLLYLCSLSKRKKRCKPLQFHPRAYAQQSSENLEISAFSPVEV